MDIQLGDILVMKKTHPCGENPRRSATPSTAFLRRDEVFSFPQRPRRAVLQFPYRHLDSKLYYYFIIILLFCKYIYKILQNN